MRWKGKVYYRSTTGILDVEFDVDEIADLDDIIERGPHFGAIDRIEIKYAHADENLTVEIAETL